VRGKVVEFREGRGFGHGIGMCQWGTEGQARMGRRAADILRFYYPGAHLTRVY
jgi:stage II sporulation protein D